MMISIEAAREIAGRALEEAPKERPLQLLADPEETTSHWIYRYDSVEYFQTGDERYGIFGGGPIAVAKADGTVQWLEDDEAISELT